MKLLEKHFNYLKYILKHKYYVLLECCKLGIPIRGLFHDLSKFLPDEYIPYCYHFYKRGIERNYIKSRDNQDNQFNKAWMLHIKRNPHHPQFWIFTSPAGDKHIEDMPLKYRKEMLADWTGAGKAQGSSNLKEWYNSNKNNLELHPNTRKWVEKKINEKSKA